MAANLQDKFRKVGASTVTTLAAPGKALADTSINVGSTTNYPTDTGIIVAIRQVDTSGELIAGTYTTWNATVTSSTSLSISSTPRTGSDQVYPAASTTQVYIVVSSAAQNDLIDGILAEHKQTGAHGDITADSITAPEGTITDLTVTTLTVGSQTPSADWTGTVAPNTVTYNGNRSYDLVFNGTDLTTAINPGTRIRTTRTVAAPTQSTSLNGTNQHWVKTSPNKMTFTDDFTAMAWITPDKYQHGGIISRFGTSGWMLRLDANGRVEIYADNGSVSRAFKSYQSVQLNKRVHVAGTLDMSAGVGLIYIDGVSVPVENSGTSGTVLVQNGNYSIGSWNGGNFFSGKIAQAAVFNAVLSASTIRNYISQGLAGNEPNIVSAHSFNGVATDLNTTTPNDLTAMNSATATNADSPFGGQVSGLINGLLDYGIVQAATFSTNTTLTVQVPEGCTIPTSGGVSSVSYSSVKAPYGMPISKNKWQVISLSMARGTVTNPIASSFHNPGSRNITVPVGAWDALLSFSSYGARGGAGVLYITSMLSTSASAFVGDPTLKVLMYTQTPASSDNVIPIERSVPFVATSATVLYLTMQNNSGATLAAMGNLDDFAPGQIVLTNTYL